MLLGRVFQFHSCTHSCPVSPAPVMKRLPFLYCIFLAPVSKIRCPQVHGFIWAFHLVLLVYISVFVPVPCCLDYCSIVVQSEVRTVDSFSSMFLSQDCFGYLSLLCFHTNCKHFCSSSVKNTIGNLIGIALNLQIALGSILFFTMLILPTHEHGIFPHLFVLFDFFHQCFIVFYIQVF